MITALAPSPFGPVRVQVIDVETYDDGITRAVVQTLDGLRLFRSANGFFTSDSETMRAEFLRDVKSEDERLVPRKEQRCV